MLLAPRPSILSQVHRSICMIMKMSMSCWPPIIRSSCSSTLLRFRSKPPMRKLRWSLRRGPWWLQSWLRGFDSQELASWCVRTFIKISSWVTTTIQGTVRMLPAVKRFCRRRRTSILPDCSVWFLKVIFRDSCIGSCTAGHCIWPSKFYPLIFQEKCLLFTLSFACHFICL